MYRGRMETQKVAVSEYPRTSDEVCDEDEVQANM